MKTKTRTKRKKRHPLLVGAADATHTCFCSPNALWEDPLHQMQILL
jgi:hypothetical protein